MRAACQSAARTLEVPEAHVHRLLTEGRRERSRSVSAPAAVMVTMRAAAIIATVATLLGGCAATPDATSLRSSALPFTTLEGAAPVQDGRAGFRDLFCSMLSADGLPPGDDPACGRWLWRLPDEPAAAPDRQVATAIPQRLAIFLVTGAFSECVAEASRPFSAGVARLRASGVSVETIVVGGRSGTAHNSRQVEDAIRRAGVGEDQPLIVIGFSKGTLDVLRLLVDSPELARQVDAVVSVASPVFGTPLADVADPPYSALLATVPHEQCPPGDGLVMRSLRPIEATQWLAANPLPQSVRYYSLAGFTTRDHVARALVPSWKYLSRIDARNDGQVLAADAVIPGSTLLGYANADHWGVAQTIENVHPVLAARRDPRPFPLEQLFVSIVRFVADDLGRSRPAAAPAAAAPSQRGEVP